jgi:ABC-type multidrug transport system fused ATPase/permease subunit
MPSPVPPNSVSDAAGHAVESQPTAPGNSTWHTAWRLVRFTAAVDPRIFWLTVATCLAGSLAEGTGLVLLLPLLAVAGMNFGGSGTASRLAVISHHLLTRSGVPQWLWLPVVLAIFLAVAGLRSVLRRAQSIMSYTATTRVQLVLSRRVYAAVVMAQWGYLVRQRSGRMTHLLTAELHRVTDAIMMSLTTINLGCLTLLYLVVALKLSAAMTLLVLALGGVLMLLQRRSLEHIRASGQELNESVGEVYAATEEHLLNTKSVKTYNAEERDVRLEA